MNNFINTAKAIEFGNPFWSETAKYGLLNIVVEYTGNGQMKTLEGHEFMNMCSYSYLGLDVHPAIVQGAANAILKAGTLNSPISRVRVHLSLLKEAEDSLSNLFNAEALTVSTCSAASAGMLPLIAAGIFSNGKRPIMLFDKKAHFSINLIKAICGDETEVISAPHNDINYIEDMCKKYDHVAYIADGVYSTGGHAPVKELMELQDKYGLVLFFDEAHSTSAYGKNGQGYVLEEMSNLTDRTIIVSSLNKGFGASGGLILLATPKHRDIVTRFGGPLTWSQRINTAGLGAILSSAEIHRTEELIKLQNQLQENINLFDRLINTENLGDGLPIRLVPIADENRAVEVAKKIFEEGFYTSPLFFPVIARGKGGLRVMMRADLHENDIRKFCSLLKQYALSEQ